MRAGAPQPPRETPDQPHAVQYGAEQEVYHRSPAHNPAESRQDATLRENFLKSNQAVVHGLPGLEDLWIHQRSAVFDDFHCGRPILGGQGGLPGKEFQVF